MKSSGQDKVEGTLRKAKGEIKEKAGQLTNDTSLEAEGTVDKTEGKTQEKVGEIKKVFGK